MNRDELLQHFASDTPEAGEDAQLSLSSRTVRVPSQRLLAVGCDETEEVQINGLLDAIHWAKWKLRTEGNVTYSIMSGDSTEAVVDGLSTLMSALPNDLGVQLHQDFEPAKLSLPDLDADSLRRLEQLRSRERFVLPAIHERISQQIGSPNFSWVRTLTGKTWTGRVDGLMVCRLDDNGLGSIQIGGANNNAVGERFRFLAEADSYPITPNNLPAATAILASLANDRRIGVLSKCQLEHLLEARVLRGAVPVSVRGETLEPVSWQFPTRWSEFGNNRFIDVLGRIGDTPWVVELKVREGGGGGSYFRHSVAQAVLYREFIRRAEGLHPWFHERQLDPLKCQAVVAFPCSHETERDQQLVSHVRYLADLFGVEVALIGDDWRNPAL